MNVSKIVIGTYNNNKKSEIRKILNGIPVRLLDLDDFENPPDVIRRWCYI